jgi:hypothetical protein
MSRALQPLRAAHVTVGVVLFSEKRAPAAKNAVVTRKYAPRAA